MHARTLHADVMLLAASAIWGAGFVAQRLGMEHCGPSTFNAARFAIGALVVLPFAVLVRARPGWQASPCDDGLEAATHPRSTGSGLLIAGIVAGTVLFIAATFQQMGLQYTTAGRAGFITGLYVLFVPMLALTVGSRTHRWTWIGACLATVGLLLMRMAEVPASEATPAGGAVSPVLIGDLLVLAGALAWAVHVLVISRLARRQNPLALASMQFAVCAVLSIAAAWILDAEPGTGLIAARWAVAYSGVCSVGIAFTLQVVAQRQAPPAHAVILLSLEAVFAAVFGYLILSERMSPIEVAGASLMLLAMLLSQLARPKRPLVA
ncbi:MAG: DMT family transporter [Planctomycetes bacterium]|nr:DMT family transporter [Planctomycetota bacterium]